jgi:hypothetical protein
MGLKHDNHYLCNKGTSCKGLIIQNQPDQTNTQVSHIISLHSLSFLTACTDCEEARLSCDSDYSAVHSAVGYLLLIYIILKIIIFRSKQKATQRKEAKQSKSTKMLKPRRPLNPYQRFFREERARVLGLSLEAAGVSATHAGDFAASSLSAEEVPSPGMPASPTAATGTAAVYAEPLAKKRKHRKTHGKISFQQLSSHVSKAWKVLDPKTKETFQAEFQVLLKKFKMDLEEYYAITAKKEQELAAMQNGAAAAARSTGAVEKHVKSLLPILPAMDGRMETISVTSSSEAGSAHTRIRDFSKLFGNKNKLTQSQKTFHKKKHDFEDEEDACSDVDGEEAYNVQPTEENLALESLAMLSSARDASHRYNHLNSQSQSQLESLQRQYQQQRERSSTLPHYLPSAATSIRASAAGGYAHGQTQTNLQAQAQVRLHLLEQEARFRSEALLRRHIHNNVPSRLHEHHNHPASLASFLAGAGGAASLAGHHGSSLSAHHAAALTHAHPSLLHHSAPSPLMGHSGHGNGHAGGPSASDVAAAMRTLNAAAAQAQAQRYHEEQQQQNTMDMNSQAHSRAETMVLLQLIEREREQRQQQVHAQQQQLNQAQAVVVAADAVRSSSNIRSNSSSSSGNGNGVRAAAASSALLKRAMVQMSRDYATSALETARSKRMRTTSSGHEQQKSA